MEHAYLRIVKTIGISMKVIFHITEVNSFRGSFKYFLSAQRMSECFENLNFFNKRNL